MSRPAAPPIASPIRPSGTLARLEHELAYLVRALEAVQRKRQYPLERAQYLLLETLERLGPQSVAALAERLLLDSSTVTRQVATLEAQGFVSRARNDDDARSVLLQATAEGIAAAAQMRDIRLGRIALLFDQWDDTERAQLAELLGKLNVTLWQAISD